MPTVAVIPVKSFALGKQRLAGTLDPGVRARLARGLADHVATTAAEAGALPLIVTADSRVAEWATRSGFPSIADPGKGLNAAAESGVAWAGRSASRWVVIHADLPLLRVSDFASLTAESPHQTVIAPSSDGGTSAIAGLGPARFAFGVSSFHRHLRIAADPVVVTRPGLLLDVDSPDDLEAAGSDPRGSWIRDLIAAAAQVPAPGIYIEGS